VQPPPRSLVPLDEIRSGGPPPDGIPPIDHPKVVSVRSASRWLAGREPVLALVHGREARAYPLQIMTWHEITNDVVDGDPITVSFCPLCNSGIAFDRRVRATRDARELVHADNAVLDFGTSGRLYRSNLVMYDRQTKSLWVQFTGQSVAGPFIGTQLRKLPVQIVSWSQFAAAYPEGTVLSRDTGFRRSYGDNPYAGYDDIASSPFLFDGRTDERLRPMERVVAVTVGSDSRAYRYASLERRARGGAAVVRDRIGSRDVVVFYRAGTASALDKTDIPSSRDVGATGVFDPVAGGRRLTFEPAGGAFSDRETGSVWDLLGRATSGPLHGSQLRRIVSDDTFWFVWAAFRPVTTIWR
jgi:hypothetical protein